MWVVGLGCIPGPILLVDKCKVAKSNLQETAGHAGSLERSGCWDEAFQAYEELFRKRLVGGDTLQALDALRGQARIRRSQGRFEEAEELAELSCEIAECGGLWGLAARAINTVATIRYQMKDWTGAKERYEKALDIARDTGDDDLIGLTCQNLGVLANICGDLREARARYLESIASSVRSGNKQNQIMAYNNLGIVCADLQEWIEAELYFGRGIEIAERSAHDPLLAMLYVNRARPLIQLREFAKAKEMLRNAEELARRIGHWGTLADVSRYWGMIAHLEGDLDTTRAHLEHAVATALEHGLEVERAGALEELGRLHQAAGQVKEAAAAFTEARDIFLSLGAVRDAARIDETLRPGAVAAA